MKNTNTLLLILCMMLGVNAMSARNLFVYSQTNGIVSFDTSNLISIDYVEATDELPAMQNFVTSDETFSFPIDEIDYVGFETPETVFVGDTDRTSSLSDYVVKADELILYLDNSIPGILIPEIGKTIFIEADGVRLSIPFAGKVTEISETDNTITVTCDAVELSDIFETYYGVLSDEDYVNETEDVTDVYMLPADAGESNDGLFSTLTPAPLSLDMYKLDRSCFEHEDDPAFTVSSVEWNKTIAPSFRYKGYFVVSKEYGTNLGVTVISDIKVTDRYSFVGGVSFSKDQRLLLMSRPIPQALVDIFFEVGLTAAADASVAVENTIMKQYRNTFRFDWSSKNRGNFNPMFNTVKVGESTSGKFAMDGSFTGGLYLKLGFAFICTSSLDIAKVYPRLEVGLKHEGSWVPSLERQDAMKTTEYYKDIKGTHYASGNYTAGAIELKLFKWSVKYDQSILEHLNTFTPAYSCQTVPDFSNLKAEKNGNQITAQINVSGNTQKCNLGFALYNQTTGTTETRYVQTGYTGPSTTLSASFTGIDDDAQYTVYPLVKVMEVEMLAEPSKDLRSFPVFGNYRCVWNTTPPNAKLLYMSLNEDYTMQQTYYYANRDENVTYTSTFEKTDSELIFHKSNGEHQVWHIDELTESTLVISQSDGFTYYLVRQ